MTDVPDDLFDDVLDAVGYVATQQEVGELRGLDLDGRDWYAILDRLREAAPEDYRA